jgi:hypothetical protein
MQELKGQVFIRDGYLDVKNVHLRHNQSVVTINGRVTWPVDLPYGQEVIAKPDLQVVASHIPVDAELLKVLPPEARGWLHSMGASGLLEVDGHVLPRPNATTAADSIAYDMNVAIHDASAKPRGSEFLITDGTGKLVVHEDRLEILELHGKRGEANLTAAGTVDWSTGNAEAKLSGDAAGLKLEPALLQLLPPQAQLAWNALDPHGTIDAAGKYHGIWDAPTNRPVRPQLVSVDLSPDQIPPPPAASTNDFDVTLHPRDVTVTPAPLPYRLDHLTGEIALTPQQVTLSNIQGRHGGATVTVAGHAITGDANNWDLALQAHDVPADDDLKKALSLPMRQMLDELKYQGNLSVDLKTLRYRGDKPDPDIDMAGTLSTSGGSVDAGVPLEKLNGAMVFDAAVRNGKLAAFRGAADLGAFTLADRPVQDFKATLDLPSGSDVLHISSIHGILAGGELAGQMDLKFPDQAASSYSMDFALKNADLREMAKQVAPKGQEIRGQASASLALQGEWADPTTRRGRGDVLIAGKQMYQIPLLLGLLDVTNLSLPTTSPFNEGTARYLVEGNRVTFEQLQMRSDSMLMSGNGWLDFGSKQVRMNFTTENPNLPRLPLISDVWDGAKQELLQIQVRGTVQSPKVSAAALHTFTTTVDEVLSGSGKEK